LLLLVQARLKRGAGEEAERAAAQLRALADSRSSPHLCALADHAAGLIAAPGAEATRYLEAALAAFGHLRLPLEEARTRLDLAGLLSTTEPAMALVEARAALERFQQLAAARDADAATSLLRQLGVRGHTGPRGSGALTRREQEVVELVGAGLSNKDIAERLFVSPRTVEHHVSNVLAKLGLTTRGQVTAYALRQ